jgi:hypothetical protein
MSEDLRTFELIDVCFEKIVIFLEDTSAPFQGHVSLSEELRFMRELI